MGYGDGRSHPGRRNTEGAEVDGRCVLDLVFPSVCIGCSRLLRTPASPELCHTCGLDLVPIDPVERCRGTPPITATYVYEGPLVDALRRLKYRGDLGMAGPLARALADSLEFELAHGGWDLVACVPTHWRRRLWRGYDHLALISGHAWTALPRDVRGSTRLDTRLLVRARAVPPQVDLPAPSRATAPIGSVGVRRHAAARGRHVLVLDDVTTTGATLRACFDSLRSAGAQSVGGLALLRVDK